jgi:phosphatidylserine/phosphatidylglycerophosphate/cardiolipin synthase-like enzyme
MAIELITDNHGSEIKGILNTVKERILIISPFLGMKTCEELSNVIIKNNLSCKVITRFYREDFIQNASSLDGLSCLLEAGAEIMSLIGLHTKLYIFDDQYSIITSANYTYGGFYSNVELGIKIENEFDIL